ncbi:MAG TPA: CPXCG motif-containing cysteine-rich protein, partial [Polyangiaceae bacterium]|nr:CPXCG motif-containing cysteine-rich protein [Polyangiaceae bacterium]
AKDAAGRAAAAALVTFDYYVPELTVASGALAHPRLYALEAPAGAVVTDAEWAALLHDADAIIRLGASFTSLELALRLAPSVEVHAADVGEGTAAIRRVLEAALASAEVSASDERSGETVGVATVTCPWCLEAVEITIEADVEGTYVQDCEVCCRPWTMTVGHDADGELSVGVERA